MKELEKLNRLSLCVYEVNRIKDNARAKERYHDFGMGNLILQRQSTLLIN